MRQPTIIKEIAVIPRPRGATIKVEISELSCVPRVRVSFARAGDWSPFTVALSREEAEALAHALLAAAPEAA